jgi:hypothetical protein
MGGRRLRAADDRKGRADASGRDRPYSSREPDSAGLGERGGRGRSVGAGKYAQHLVREVAALEATLAVHDDPSIAEGTLVQFDLPVVLAEAEA